jgi:hypothetical protein
MNDKNIEVIDLGRKISLLLQNGFNHIKTAARLAEKSGINESEISRFRNGGGTRINFNKFNGLCETYSQIPEQLWYQSFEVFAQEIGLSNFQKPSIFTTNNPEISMMDIYFEPRNRDKAALQETFEIMKGYWEYYRYAVSNEENRCIVYGSLEVTNLSDDGFFECTTIEYGLEYKGYFYQGSQGLFFKLKEKNPMNGEIFVITNIPNMRRQPKINGILLGLTADSPSLYQSPAAAKIAFRHIGSLDKLKEKYKISDTDISVNELTKTIYLIISSGYVLPEDIMTAIDNHIPYNSLPYALRTSKYNTTFTEKELFTQLQATLHHKSSCEIEKMFLTDYLNLLTYAMNEGEYRFIKLSDYFRRIGLLAKNTNQSIIATYVLEDYDHDNIELNKFSQVYLETQIKLIQEKSISVCRMFITKDAEPNDFLLQKMYREEQVGIEVLYLQDREWINASLRINYIVDFAMFDETKAIMLGEKEPFCSIQSASLITNKAKISELFELFNANKIRAKSLTDEMRQKAKSITANVPKNVSLADELIAERHEEARRDGAA